MTSGLFVPGDEYHTFYMGEYAMPMRHILEMERQSGGTFHLRVEHRPIESYVRAFAAAGLAVSALREPLPSVELAATHPEFETRHVCRTSCTSSPAALAEGATRYPIGIRNSSTAAWSPTISTPSTAIRP